jgi:hypothetical protein
MEATADRRSGRSAFASYCWARGKKENGLLQFAGIIADRPSETAIISAVLALTFIKPLSAAEIGV